MYRFLVKLFLKQKKLQAILYSLFLFTFLVFPKIVIRDSNIYYKRSGILIGEIILVYLILFSVRRVPRFGFIPKILVILFLFSFFLVVLSSTLQWLNLGIFPNEAYFYFLRILSYFLIFPLMINIIRWIHKSEEFYKLYINSYLFHSILSILIYIYYFLKYMPNLNDQIWVQHVGYRLFSLFGLGFTLSDDDLLTVVGGGSSNLLASWSIGFLVLVDNFETRKTKRYLFYFLAFLMVSLASSRGGIISIFIYIFYRLFVGSNTISKFTLSGFITIFTFIIYFIINYLEIDVPLITRLMDTYQGGGDWDGSSQGRFDNYIVMYNLFLYEPLSIFFGLGFDENILYSKSGWTLVESFLGTTIFCGGFFSTILFFYFYYSSFKLRFINIWYKSLWLFLVFQIIINWSITGGDFFSAPSLFTMVYFISLGFFKSKNYIK